MAAHTHFICSLGIGKYEPETYRLGDSSVTVTTALAPAAVARLVALDGARASVLVTPKAEERWYAQLAQELGPDGAGLEPQAVRVPLGSNADDLQKILMTLVDRVEADEQVVLDVSLALRHLPFAYFSALTYLTAYKRVTIAGIYNAAREAKLTDGTVPVVNLTPLFDLTRWYHVLRSVQESGEIAQVGAMVRAESSRLQRERQVGRVPGQPQQPNLVADILGTLKKPLETLAPAVSAGLPLEVGLAAARVAPLLRQLGASESSPALRLGVEEFARWVDRWALAGPPANKKSVTLDEEELRRQLDMAEWYVQRERLPAALLVLREWLISLLYLRTAQPGPWLGHQRRQPMEQLLNDLAERSKWHVATAPERELASLWSKIRNARDRFAHAGFDEQIVAASKADIDNILADCRNLLTSETITSLPKPSGGTLLLTPLGNSPGVLFTAVKLEQLARVIVISSETAQVKVEEALTAADATDLPCEVLLMRDPHAGFDEAQSFVTPGLRRLFVGANRVVANVTGGTTVMQHVVDALAREARRLGAPVQRVAMVDRRSVEEQRQHPYVLGERVLLEDSASRSSDAE